MQQPPVGVPSASPLSFGYESTGVETYFRDERDPDARSRRVFSFHRPESLGLITREYNGPCDFFCCTARMNPQAESLDHNRGDVSPTFTFKTSQFLFSIGTKEVASCSV
jgi:hypothetical protein